MTRRPLMYATATAFAIVLVACGAPDRPVLPLEGSRALPWQGIHASGVVQYRGRMERRNAGELHGILEVVNVDIDTVEVLHGECSLGVRAYVDEGLLEPAVWDNHFPDEVMFCHDVGILLTLAPQEVGEVSALLDESQMPSGQLYFALVFEVEGERHRVAAGTARIR